MKKKMWLISLGFGFGKTRAVQCYVTLLVWIIIVSLGLYWFLNRSNTTNKDRFLWTLENYRWEANHRSSYSNYDDSYGAKESVEGFKAETTWKIPINSKKSVEFSKASLLSRKKTEALSDIGKSFLHSSVNRLCNPPEEIAVQDENLQVPEYKLDALVIIFRHGDRGPLSHVGSRNLSLVNCSSTHPEFQKFFRFTTDVLTKLGGYSQFIGPFHSFQKVPTSGQCHLGQLSQLGASQLLQLGKIIRSGYQSTLFNSTSHSLMNAGVASSVSEAATNNGSNNYHVNDVASHPLQNIKVIAYSTRYRRTLQSLMAFLYGLLGPKLMIPNVVVRESQSITFCFNDCSCRAADRLKKVASKKYRPAQFDKTAMINLINQINSIIDIKTKTKKSGATLLDLLLLYPCHKSDFPCREKSFMRKVHSGSTSDECVKMEDVSSLIALLQKENHSQKKIPANRQLSLLSSYGLLKEIVNLALKMTSSSPSSNSGGGGSIKNSNIPYSSNNNNAKTKVAIFSGHDTTLLCLTGALGIFTGHPDIHLVPYASRVIFEFYRKTNVPPNSARKHFFRIIFNGQAVTHLVRFCKEPDTVVLVNSSKNSSKSYNTLCPLENLVRFLHDNYFETFGNATNFKDACHK